MNRLILAFVAGLLCTGEASLAQDGNSPEGETANDHDNTMSFEGDVYRLTGESRRCLRDVDIEWIAVADKETLIFATADGGYYFNRVVGGIYCDLPTDEPADIDIFPSRTIGGVGVGASHNYCKNDGVMADYVRCTLGTYEEAVVVERETDNEMSDKDADVSE